MNKLIQCLNCFRIYLFNRWVNAGYKNKIENIKYVKYDICEKNNKKV